MGREMKRSQASIRGHLINLGLMEYEAEPVYENNYRSYVSSPIGDIFARATLIFILLSKALNCSSLFLISFCD